MKRKTLMTVPLAAVLISGVLAVAGGGGVPAASGAVPEPTNEKVIGRLTVQGIPTTVNIRSFAWELTKQSSGPPVFTDFRVTKPLDRTSPLLFDMAARGVGVGTVTVEVYRPVSGNEIQTIYTLSNAFITTVEDGHSGSADEGPLESVNFTYRKVEERFIPESGADVVRCYDRQQQAAC